MDERRKSSRRAGSERRKGSDPKFHEGVSKGYFVDERKGERRLSDRRKSELKPGDPASGFPPPPADPAAIDAWVRQAQDWFWNRLNDERKSLLEFHQNGLQAVQKDFQKALAEAEAPWRARNAELAAELNALKSAPNESAKLKRQVEEALKRNETMDTELRSLREKAASLEKSIDETRRGAEAAEKKHEKVRAELERRLHERESELDQARRQIAALEKKAAEPAIAAPKIESAPAAVPAKPKPPAEVPADSEAEYAKYLLKMNERNAERELNNEALIYVLTYEEWRDEMRKRSHKKKK